MGASLIGMRAKAPRDPRGRRRTTSVRWLIPLIGASLLSGPALATVDAPAPAGAAVEEAAVEAPSDEAATGQALPAPEEAPGLPAPEEAPGSDAPSADAEPPPREDPEAREEDAPVDKRVLGSPREGGALASAWSEVQSDLERKAWTEAMGRLPHLVEMRNDLGYPSLEPMSAVLLHAARSAADHGALEGAHTLAEAAATLSPGSRCAPRRPPQGWAPTRPRWRICRRLRAGCTACP